MKRLIKFLNLFLLFVISSSLSAKGNLEKSVTDIPDEPAVSQQTSFDIGVFVPGVVAGSPLYEQMVEGTKMAAEESELTTFKIVEAGFNQGEWEEKLMALAAMQDYELIVTSNGAMPYLALSVAEAFPDQRFLILDAIYPNHPQMHTLLYNQIEQASMVGYLAALITGSSLEGATSISRVGLIAGQRYPALDKMIIPGFELGTRHVSESVEIDIRILGNWYDAQKAADLANSMFDSGVDVILTVAGSANLGVIEAAKTSGKYVLCLDGDIYDLSPGTVVGCASLKQKKAVFERVRKAIAGTLKYGEAEIVGVRSGYVDFVDTDPGFIEALPLRIREPLSDYIKRLRTGEVSYEIPRFW